MGLLDNIAQRVADRIAESSNFAGYGNAVPLERTTEMANVPFAPGMPLIPANINPIRPDDNRPDPRRWEFEVAQNINVTGNRLIPFKTLRAAADNIDILRRCIEVLKSKMVGLEWDITLGQDAIEAVMVEQGIPQIKASAIAKEKFAPEINRLRKFWEMPDISNGLDFTDWLMMALEEVLVIDALAIWPQKTVGGDVKGLQILDGSTIKPLIDDRGMRPEAPNAAFQQILYGFPRSEFSAPSETEVTDGEFSSDELAYLVRNRRTHTVYGNSPVERALSLADIYLRRQQWIRAEFTDGVTPEMMMKTTSNFTPEQKRAWENIFNDDLAGQTEQRHRATILPADFDPVFAPGYDQKFNDLIDNFLITGITGHFGVLPTEIGYSAKSGLGGSGHQQGEASSAGEIGLAPLMEWLGKQLSKLSYVYLGMPRELEFKFQPSVRDDALARAQATSVEQASGNKTINEARAEMGLPLLEADIADQPIIGNTYVLTKDGAVPLAPQQPAIAPSEAVNQADDETLEGEEIPLMQGRKKPVSADTANDATKSDVPEDVAEMRRFMKKLRKNPTRSFKFDFVPETYGETLNKFLAIQDFDGARWYAERYLG